MDFLLRLALYNLLQKTKNDKIYRVIGTKFVKISKNSQVFI